MELNVRNDSKIVEIWLTREEKQDAQLQKKLKLVYQSFHETGYTVATFLSGEQALEEITSGLICYVSFEVVLIFFLPFSLEIGIMKALRQGGISMALPAEKKETIFTYADYLTWDEDERIELIDGEAVMMAPPSTSHQIISGELFRQLANFLEGKKCLAIPAPFAVRLFEREGDPPANVRTVVEPDISVICDRNKLDAHGCKGAPDMVIEILSPSNRRHDRLVKLDLYQRAGVREYWIVSPEAQTVEVFLLEDGRFIVQGFYEKNDIAKVHALEGCFVELCKVFAE